jgi:hypothetical protein
VKGGSGQRPRRVASRARKRASDAPSVAMLRLDQVGGLGAGVDEQRGVGAAGERLEPQRAGAGEEVEHACALGRRRVAVGPVGEQVEEALAHPVGGGAQAGGGVARAEGGERAPAPAPGDDAHQASVLRSASGSAMRSGSGETPASIQRFAVM